MDKLILGIKKWTIINFFIERFLVAIGIVGLLKGVTFIVKEICFYENEGMIIVHTLEAGVLIALCCYGLTIYRKKRKLQQNGEVIQANFCKDEFKFGLNTYYNRYYIVAYFNKGNRTYKFNCEVLDADSGGIEIFNAIKQKGDFPPITILVDKDNYNNYDMKVYDFLNETLHMNKEIVDSVRYNMSSV